MNAWGFVFLAYGIVWGAIVLYFISLRCRLRRAETELAQMRAVEETSTNETK